MRRIRASFVAAAAVLFALTLALGAVAGDPAGPTADAITPADGAIIL